MPLLRHLHNSILLYHIYVHVLGNLRAESLSIPYLFVFFKDFSYLFLETGKGREKERERNIYVREKHDRCMSPAGDLAHNSGMCPDWELSQQPLSSQAGTQSTEPHQPGPIFMCTTA